VVLAAAQQLIEAAIFGLTALIAALRLSQLVPALGLAGSLAMLFALLTPAAYRARRHPKWPGVLLTAAWWLVVAAALPVVLRGVFATKSHQWQPWRRHGELTLFLACRARPRYRRKAECGFGSAASKSQEREQGEWAWTV